MVNLGPLALSLAHHEHHEYEPYFCAGSSMDEWAKWPTYFTDHSIDSRISDIEMEWQCRYCGNVHPPDESKCWDGVDGCGAPKTASVKAPIRAYNPYGWNNPR